jgi:hypothetical protein
LVEVENTVLDKETVKLFEKSEGNPFYRDEDFYIDCNWYFGYTKETTIPAIDPTKSKAEQ